MCVNIYLKLLLFKTTIHVLTVKLESFPCYLITSVCWFLDVEANSLTEKTLEGFFFENLLLSSLFLHIGVYNLQVGLESSHFTPKIRFNTVGVESRISLSGDKSQRETVCLYLSVYMCLCICVCSD